MSAIHVPLSELVQRKPADVQNSLTWEEFCVGLEDASQYYARERARVIVASATAIIIHEETFPRRVSVRSNGWYVDRGIEDPLVQVQILAWYDSGELLSLMRHYKSKSAGIRILGADIESRFGARREFQRPGRAMIS